MNADRLDIGLGRGWTLQQVEDVAVSVARSYNSYGLCDPEDVRLAARDALLEELYADNTAEDLTAHDGWRVAMRGARRHDLAERRHRGRDHDTWTQVSYGAVIYVTSQPTPPTPDGLVLDRLALRQVWSTLRPVDAETLIAWATFDSREQAAAAVGCTRQTFNWRLGQAKARFLRTWWDGEPVPPPYGHDRKATPPSGDGDLDLSRERGRRKNWRRRRAAA